MYYHSFRRVKLQSVWIPIFYGISTEGCKQDFVVCFTIPWWLDVFEDS